VLLAFPSPPVWYVLQVQPLREFRVREQLERAGIEHYLPVRKRKGWRGLELDAPVFPGYVFARNACAADLYDLFRPTRWLLRLLGDRRGPASVPDSQVETLRLMLTRPKIEITDLWQGGEEVEITAGPLAGAIGRVAYVKNKVRLIVSIEMLGRAVSAELDAAAVRAMAQPKAA
jgi:transcriptional antiterminator NusG